MSTSLVAIQDIIDVPEGTTPGYPYLKSMARHIKAAQAELAALEAGSEPGFAASIDLRYFAEDVGAADALEIVPTQEPESGDALVSGMYYDILIAANNTGPATLEVRNTADDVSITKNVKTQDGDALVAGQLKAGRVERFQYINDGAIDEWRVLLIRDMTNPMTAAGDMIIGGTSGVPNRLAKGTTGRHMRAGSSGPEYGGAVDMGGDTLRGQGVPRVSVGSASSLNNGTHRAAIVQVTANVAITIDPHATTAYSDDYQTVILATHASGCTVTAGAGVSLNGVTAGSATINQYEAFSLIRDASDTWIMPNASVS